MRRLWLTLLCTFTGGLIAACHPPAAKPTCRTYATVLGGISCAFQHNDYSCGSYEGYPTSFRSVLTFASVEDFVAERELGVKRRLKLSRNYYITSTALAKSLGYGVKSGSLTYTYVDGQLFNVHQEKQTDSHVDQTSDITYTQWDDRLRPVAGTDSIKGQFTVAYDAEQLTETTTYLATGATEVNGYDAEGNLINENGSASAVTETDQICLPQAQ